VLASGPSVAAEGETAATDDAAALYREQCASCHGETRLGAQGPALLPESLGRLRPAAAVSVIRDGRLGTQMPGFGSALDSERIERIARWLYTDPVEVPRWDAAEIRASLVRHVDLETLPSKPSFDADPLNLCLVVEQGDHHVTVLDGDALVPLHRFETRFALHGGIKYSPDGRFAYLGSRDGWVSVFDLYSLQLVAEIRAGLHSRNIAVSGDGRTLLVANTLPPTVVALDANTLELIKVIPAQSRAGRPSRVSAVYAAPPRHSFIVALKDVPELWELDDREDARASYTGMVHDYRQESGEPIERPLERLPIRRIELDGILDDFFFDPEYRNLVGASRDGGAWVVNLDVGRVIERLDLPGLPHLGSGITWTFQGRQVMASQNLREPQISVVDTETWKIIKRIPTQGPGFFLRSHENTPYAWADVYFGEHRDLVNVIDKATLEIHKTLRPAPGKTSGHVEFTRDGKYALLSISEPDGELIVYDARTLEIRKRLPMKQPSGKYNVYNKISGSSGTSH